MSKILEKSNRVAIDEMVVDNNILEMNEILERKIEARDNCLFSIAKIVAQIEHLRERIEKLNAEMVEHNRIIKAKLGIDGIDGDDQIDYEIKVQEKGFSTNVENHVKSVNEEKHLYSKLRYIEENITKQNCINAATRIEMSVLGELLENLSSSIKTKDLELLGLVSENEDVGEKLKKLETLNKQLDSTLEKREKVAQSVMDLDAEISKQEFELATLLNEKDGLEKEIKTLKTEEETDGLQAKYLQLASYSHLLGWEEDELHA